ncbi:glycine zipper family protein [Gordonia sp. C13]|uniref:glycine zipper family protein n=1 Tax=Gordonia sp. C13 TaxID=2935078 RepID=UPI00200B1783|nr:glycine zipper family protein [Gordonia sp. C13]MCK8615569.1 glycine zipper family protein [Gordonia sp. C13]
MSTERQDGALSRKSTRTLVAVAISLAAVVITALAGTAQAAPKQFGPATYDANWNQSSLTLTLHNASASTENGTLTIRDFGGAEVFRMPLAYRMEDRQFPIDARQAGNKVTLIPSRNNARSVAVNAAEVNSLRHQVAAPTTRQERDDQALTRFQQQLSAGTTVSSLVGTIVGAIVGGLIGCIVGITAAVVGCLVGVAPAAAVGGIIGLALGGGGTLIGAGLQYFQTINSPFKAPKK